MFALENLTLEELRERARLAARSPIGRITAVGNDPHAAYTQAKEDGLPVDMCESIRYLSYIRVAHGEEVFMSVCEIGSREEINRRRSEYVADCLFWLHRELDSAEKWIDQISSCKPEEISEGLGLVSDTNSLNAALMKLDTLNKRIKRLQAL